MPQATDLTGIGVPPEVARELGNQANTLTCAGTTSGTAATIKTTNTELSAASNQTGAIFQSSTKVGTPYYFFCSSSTSAVIYVPTSSYLNGVQNGTLTVAQNASAIVWQYKLNYFASK